MHWDGDEWTTVDSPVQDGHLYGVSAVSSDDVWVAGFHFDGLNNTLIEHWDGENWTVVDSPKQEKFSELYGITAVSADDVWAVGDFTNKAGLQTTLTVHWDGESWTKVKSERPPSG